MADWYPVMLNVKEKLCVVIGGGAVAERKLRGLLEAGARVRIVSPVLTASLSRIADQHLVEWRPKLAEETDVEGAMLVFAAADDPEVNRRIAGHARSRGMMVNLADDGESGDFILPAVLRRGKFVISASVSGAGPALASRVIRDLAGRYGEEYSEYADILNRIRNTVKTFVMDPGQRHRILSAVSDEKVLREWRDARFMDDPDERLLMRLKDLAAAAARQDEDRR